MPAKQRFSASWDATARAMTVMAVLIFIAGAAGFSFFGSALVYVGAFKGGVAGIVGGVVLLVVLVGRWLFVPRGYRVNELGVWVERIWSDMWFGWDAIESVDRVTVPLAPLIKGGPPGLFGWCGVYSPTGGFRALKVCWASRMRRKRACTGCI